jgi:nicotinate-nucleotide--dimethylbenzimidazole phosphoribosyltransferase
VLLDGDCAIAAAGLLHRVSPFAVTHCRLGVAAVDPACAALAVRLGLEPLVNIAATPKDGTGSVAALCLVRLACALGPQV